MAGSELTIGSRKGSGADFDPGTHPNPGDSSGTDCARAFQAALDEAVNGPGGDIVPRRIELQAGIFRFWLPGTSPRPLLVRSGRQEIWGAGHRATGLHLMSGGPTDIPVGQSPFHYVNPSDASLQLTVDPSSTIWTGDSPIRVNDQAMLALSGLGPGAGAWNAARKPVTYCVQPGGRLQLEFSGPPPKLSSNLSFLMWASPPALGGVRGLGVNALESTWANGIDVAGDPNLGLAYPEGGQRTMFLEHIGTYCKSGGFSNFDIIGDGMEQASLCDIFTHGSLSWVVVAGTVTLQACTLHRARLSGQVVHLVNPTFGTSSLGPAVEVVAVGAQNQAIRTPLQLNYHSAYFNDCTDGAVPAGCVVNYNAATATVHNVDGGNWVVPAGPAPPGYFVGNERTSVINLRGSPTFRKTKDNPVPLTSSPPAGLSIEGALLFVGVETVGALLSKTYVGWNAPTPAIPGSGVDVPNSLGVAVDIYLTSVGDGVQSVGITDPLGGFLVIGLHPGPGHRIHLEPGAKVRLIYSGSPTWRWYGCVIR